MPHACNTYDWRGIVLRRRARTERWPLVFDAVFKQKYLEEAPVVIIWAVQPKWWAEHYRENINELVQRGLIDLTRAGDLLDLVEAGPGQHIQMTGALVGEAMMGLTAAMLAALDAGLGATLAACRPVDMAKALELPDDAEIAPFGVLAVGYAVEAPSGSAPKPDLSEVYFDGRWGTPLRSGDAATAHA
jgi:nitroreductase